MKTGKLIFTGNFHYKCIDCETIFPVIGLSIKCNGHNISKCPWCRADTEIWQNGRGL